MLINVTIGGVTKRLPDKRPVQINKLFVHDYQVPYVEGGSQGIMEADELSKSVVFYENENEAVTATEYWEGSELRHRSVNMHLKQGLPTLEAIAGEIN